MQVNLHLVNFNISSESSLFLFQLKQFTFNFRNIFLSFTDSKIVLINFLSMSCNFILQIQIIRSQFFNSILIIGFSIDLILPLVHFSSQIDQSLKRLLIFALFAINFSLFIQQIFDLIFEQLVVKFSIFNSGLNIILLLTAIIQLRLAVQ